MKSILPKGYTWGKPVLSYSSGKWHATFRTEYDWSWYIGSGNTMKEAYECFISARKMTCMMMGVLKRNEQVW